MRETLHWVNVDHDYIAESSEYIFRLKKGEEKYGEVSFYDLQVRSQRKPQYLSLGYRFCFAGWSVKKAALHSVDKKIWGSIDDILNRASTLLDTLKYLDVSPEVKNTPRFVSKMIAQKMTKALYDQDLLKNKRESTFLKVEEMILRGIGMYRDAEIGSSDDELLALALRIMVAMEET